MRERELFLCVFEEGCVRERVRESGVCQVFRSVQPAHCVCVCVRVYEAVVCVCVCSSSVCVCVCVCVCV